MGLESRLSRLEGLEQLIEERIEARVEQELDAAIHSLEQHLTRQELRRVLEILSAAEEEPQNGPIHQEEMHEAYRKEQVEKAAKEAQERDHRRQRMERTNARRAWLADGGSEADFEKAWPSLRDEGRRRRVMDADRRAREAMRNGTTSRI